MPVLITSYQVSPNLKIGPVMSQIMITDTAIIKAVGCPVFRAVAFAKRVNKEVDFVECRRPLILRYLLIAFNADIKYFGLCAESYIG